MESALSISSWVFVEITSSHPITQPCMKGGCGSGEVVEYDPQKVDTQTIKNTIEDQGYEVQ